MHKRFEEVMTAARSLALPREILVQAELCGNGIHIEDWRKPAAPDKFRTLDADEAIDRLRRLAFEIQREATR